MLAASAGGIFRTGLCALNPPAVSIAIFATCHELQIVGSCTVGPSKAGPKSGILQRASQNVI